MDVTDRTDVTDRPESAEFFHLVDTVQASWPDGATLLGIVLFGSRAKFRQQRQRADWDLGIVYAGDEPHFSTPADWDLFLWSTERWEAGFALQVEIARTGIVLFDPEGLVERRFAMIREHILPFWGGYLKRF